jgi:hypothetical protein
MPSAAMVAERRRARELQTTTAEQHPGSPALHRPRRAAATTTSSVTTPPPLVARSRQAQKQYIPKPPPRHVKPPPPLSISRFPPPCQPVDTNPLLPSPPTHTGATYSRHHEEYEQAAKCLGSCVACCCSLAAPRSPHHGERHERLSTWCPRPRRRRMEGQRWSRRPRWPVPIPCRDRWKSIRAGERSEAVSGMHARVPLREAH